MESLSDKPFEDSSASDITGFKPLFLSSGPQNLPPISKDLAAVTTQSPAVVSAGVPLGLSLGVVAKRPISFYFNGNSTSLKSRVDYMKEQEEQRIVDASISLSGKKVQSMSMMGILCTMIWGGIFLFPLLLLLCNCWKRCTHAIYTVEIEAYRSIAKLMKAASIRQMAVRINDNHFTDEKASILQEGACESKLKAFSLINVAEEYDYKGQEYTRFASNMQPFMSMSGVQCDIRWGKQVLR